MVKEKDNWVKVKLDTELIENHSRLLLDHFSNSGPVSGTSLVALNLNNEDKAIVYEDENDGETKIKVMISYLYELGDQLLDFLVPKNRIY